MRPTPLPPSYPLSRSAALLLILALSLAGCQTPLNELRVQRLGGLQTPAVPDIQPQALALGLSAAAQGTGLSPASLQSANELLNRQGRISAQTLTITPFNDKGQQLAQRLAQALVRSGAQTPRILPVPTDAARLAEAAQQQWDLELSSAAMVVRTPDCRIADGQVVALRPFDGVGPLGCANRSNLARMTSDPRDLSRGRALAPADGKTAALAVERYQNGETRALIDINFDQK